MDHSVLQEKHFYITKLQLCPDDLTAEFLLLEFAKICEKVSA